MVTAISPALQSGTKVADNVDRILKGRYLRKDLNGNIIEDANGMFDRVAHTVAQGEKTKKDKTFWEKEFKQIMVDNDFLPNSPTMMNAGISGTLSACFVIGLKDDMESILYAGQKAGMVLKYGGGVGYYLGNLRSKGQYIASTHGKACGPIAVLKFLNEVSRMITQGGKRDGANMAILDVSHPDIREFIHCKDANAGSDENNQVISDFNISVSIPDAFMDAVKLGKAWNLVDPATQKITETIDASDLFNEIATSAYATGDPGLFFVDTVNELNTTPNLGKLESTNPCGEVPLYPEEACNLGSINLNNFIREDKAIEWDKLSRVTRTAIRFLDNVVTVNKFPIKEIRKAVDTTRKLGLGVMGWHDMLLKLDIPYESEQAAILGKQVMVHIQKAARKMSNELAEERGEFPGYEGSIFDVKTRNATVTCIAPTGTISRIAGASSGIEPVFAWAFKSNIMRGQLTEPIIDIHPYFEEYFSTNYAPTDYDLILEHVLEHGNLAKCVYVKPEDKVLFKTANELDIDIHLAHQSAYQSGTDLAVSKTINMSEASSVQEIKDAYINAHSVKCKGITIYRDKSRYQILNAGVDENKKDTAQTVEVKFDINDNNEVSTPEVKPSMPWALNGKRYKVPSPSGPDVLVHISYDEQDMPREVVINIGKTGSDVQTVAEAMGRLITLALKSDVPLERIFSQLNGITSGSAMYFMGAQIKSLPDAVAFALRDFMDANTDTLPEEISGDFNSCPECANEMVSEEGCKKCYTCGYAAC